MNVLQSDGCGARDRDGKLLVSPPMIPPVDPEAVELITEFHITRDLRAAGRLVDDYNVHALDDELAPVNPEETVKLDVPDVVIVIGDQLIVCEAKFFSAFSRKSVEKQLWSQRKQIAHLFDARPSLTAYRHLAILPVRLEGDPPEWDHVLTWSDIAELANKVLGSDHYVCRRLWAGVRYYEALAGPADPGSAPDGQGSLHEVVDFCRSQEKAIWIGFTGGKKALRKATEPELLVRTWKWRNAPGTIKSNWIRSGDFLSVLSLRWPDDIPPPPPSRKRWDPGLSLVELRERCQSTHATFVGYNPGAHAFHDEEKKDDLLKRLGRNDWKWHDPKQHPFLNTENTKRTWIPCSEFLARVAELGDQD